MITSSKPSIEEALQHYGVKGMKWGVRKNSTAGVSRRVDREARKDAQEYARAKMFYGEGAGTRRKLIKATVEGKAKRDPSYKKAFDNHVERQNMDRHATKARRERRRKDTAKATGKTVRGVNHVLNGNSQYASAVVALSVGGALAAHKSGIDKVVYDATKTKLSDMQSNRKNARTVNDLLKTMNLD